jgi:translocation and assembly module TamB
MLRDGADLRVQVDDLDLTPWLRHEGLPDEGLRSEGLRGQGPQGGGQACATATLVWRTNGTADVRAMLQLTTAGGGGWRQPGTATVWVRGDDRAITLDRLHLTWGPAVVSGSGELSASPLALLDAGTDALRALPVRADVHLRELPLTALPDWAGTDLPFDELRGRLTASAALRGTLAAPEVTATVRLAEGALRTRGGERLEDLGFVLEASPRAVRLSQGQATRGKAPLSFEGELVAATPLWQAWPHAELTFSVQGTNVLLHRRSGLKVRADVDLLAQGPLTAVALTGRVGLRDSRLVTRVPFFDFRRTGGESTDTGLQLPEIDLPEPMRVDLDVDIVTAEPFAIDSNVLEGNLHAQLEVLGDLSDPRLQGAVSGPDAYVILPGCRLRATTLLLQFTDENPEVPTLTVTARGRRHGYDITVNVRGRYDRPDIEFTSDPALPPDELVVLVTTGARPSALRGTRGVGTVLGSYVAQEFADWIFGSESTEAKEGFLDRFTVETGTEVSRRGNESIVVEFKLGEHTYLQGERDVYEDINMGLVYRLRFR